jgi:prepilin-type N-terminal cleavage/methylation domain-containing protein
MVPRSRPRFGAFSLIEMLIVLVIISVLVGVALPSWRAYQDQAVLREAKWVLQRLDIAQRDFMLRHGRYATEIELPDLTTLSPIVDEAYRLQVDIGEQAFSLQLMTKAPSLPDLRLNHLGVWSEQARAGAL